MKKWLLLIGILILLNISVGYTLNINRHTPHQIKQLETLFKESQNMTPYNTERLQSEPLHEIYFAPLKMLRTIPSKQNKDVIQWINAHLSKLPAPYYLELATRYYDEREYKEAVYWQKLGYLLLSYDIDRCTDQTAGIALYDYLNTYQGLTDYTLEPFKGKQHEMRQIVLNMYDDMTHVAYFTEVSPIYLCSYSKSAISISPQSIQTLIQPKSEWPNLKEKFLTEIHTQLVIPIQKLETQSQPSSKTEKTTPPKR